jgi:hypothetical protein
LREFLAREPPSFFFSRQVYVTLWQEARSIPLPEDFQDNVILEPDLSHETGLGPGPCSPAKHGRETARENLAELLEDGGRKVLHDNAATVGRLG